MGMGIYGKDSKSEAGTCYRASIWTWSPVLSIAKSANEIYGLGIDMSKWDMNDGHGLNTQAECDALANAITSLLEVEKDIIKSDHLPMALGFADAFNIKLKPQAEVTKDRVVSFVEFLRNCGGFYIY